MNLTNFAKNVEYLKGPNNAALIAAIAATTGLAGAAGYMYTRAKQPTPGLDRYRRNSDITTAAYKYMDYPTAEFGNPLNKLKKKQWQDALLKNKPELIDYFHLRQNKDTISPTELIAANKARRRLEYTSDNNDFLYDDYFPIPKKDISMMGEDKYKYPISRKTTKTTTEYDFDNFEAPRKVTESGTWNSTNPDYVQNSYPVGNVNDDFPNNENSEYVGFPKRANAFTEEAIPYKVGQKQVTAYNKERLSALVDNPKADPMVLADRLFYGESI